MGCLTDGDRLVLGRAVRDERFLLGRRSLLALCSPWSLMMFTNSRRGDAESGQDPGGAGEHAQP